MTLSNDAVAYWLACHDMRHGDPERRPMAAHNLIQIGTRDDDGPVTVRARKQINEAAGVLVMFDAA